MSAEPNVHLNLAGWPRLRRLLDSPWGATVFFRTVFLVWMRG